eukprot:scaffold141989_cov28-Tisochrysis_lutea.AAC.1
MPTNHHYCISASFPGVGELCLQLTSYGSQIGVGLGGRCYLYSRCGCPHCSQLLFQSRFLCTYLRASRSAALARDVAVSAASVSARSLAAAAADASRAALRSCCSVCWRPKISSSRLRLASARAASSSRAMAAAESSRNVATERAASLAESDCICSSAAAARAESASFRASSSS